MKTTKKITVYFELEDKEKAMLEETSELVSQIMSLMTTKDMDLEPLSYNGLSYSKDDLDDIVEFLTDLANYDYTIN